jgi:MerR family copper efflux transcriptional regulator
MRHRNISPKKTPKTENSNIDICFFYKHIRAVFISHREPCRYGKVKRLLVRRNAAVNIGQAARESGVSAKMIRYYESIGLVPQVSRTDGGYRSYGRTDVNRLKFIRRARELGFSAEKVRELLKLWADSSRHCAEVKDVALEHIAALEERALELQKVIQTLRRLADICPGDNQSNCPIIQQLESGCACRSIRHAESNHA